MAQQHYGCPNRHNEDRGKDFPRQTPIHAAFRQISSLVTSGHHVPAHLEHRFPVHVKVRYCCKCRSLREARMPFATEVPADPAVRAPLKVSAAIPSASAPAESFRGPLIVQSACFQRSAQCGHCGELCQMSIPTGTSLFAATAEVDKAGIVAVARLACRRGAVIFRQHRTSARSLCKRGPLTG